MIGVIALDESLAPRDADALANLITGAIGSFRNAVEIDPANSDAKTNLELALRIAKAASLGGEAPPAGARRARAPASASPAAATDMGSVSFLTPAAALVALLGLVPVVAFLRRERRARDVRARLGLGEPPVARDASRSQLSSPLRCSSVFAAPAGARPPTSRQERADAEVLFVLDTSRSMSPRPARRRRHASTAREPTRSRVRALAEVRAGSPR